MDVKFNVIDKISDVFDNIINPLDDIYKYRSLLKISHFLEYIKLAKRWATENRKSLFIEIEEEESLSILRNYVTVQINVDNVLLRESIVLDKSELNLLIERLKPLNIPIYKSKIQKQLTKN